MAKENLLLRIKNSIYKGWFELAVSMGFFENELIDKFGEIDTIISPGVIWGQGGILNYSDTPDITTASSSSALDIGQLFFVKGILDPNGEGQTTGYFVTNGQNKVLIYGNKELAGDPLSFWRISTSENISLAGEGSGKLAGKIYVYVDTPISGGVPTDSTKIRTVVDSPYDRTLQAFSTIPPKYVGFLKRGEFGMTFTGNPSAGTQYAKVGYNSRRYGMLFTTKKVLSIINVGSGIYQDNRPFPDTVPALTDIEMYCFENSDVMGLWGTFNILLINEKHFSKRYLKSIGQPNY